jgi:hypothetical protein
LDTFICQANEAGVKYFFFEFMDEPWKDAQFGGVEGWWGIFNSKYGILLKSTRMNDADTYFYQSNHETSHHS